MLSSLRVPASLAVAKCNTNILVAGGDGGEGEGGEDEDKEEGGEEEEDEKPVIEIKTASYDARFPATNQFVPHCTSHPNITFRGNWLFCLRSNAYDEQLEWPAL